MLEAALAGLTQAVAWPAFGYMLLGIAVGFAVGILPGLGGPKLPGQGGPGGLPGFGRKK